MSDVGFIFDLDGVLTETSEYHYRSWKRLADEEGISFTREDNEALRGVPRRTSLELLLKGELRPEPEMQEMMTRKNHYYQAFLEDITPDDLLPGVGEFLQQARAENVKMGLGSASKNARKVCEQLGIVDWLDAFGDGYSVVNPKPAPDLFIWVAGRLGLYPMRCVVFEDAEAGINAALGGGFKTVGIGPEERVGHAHQILPDLKGTDVGQFIALARS